MNDRHSVWEAGVDLQGRTFDKFGRERPRIRKGNDLIVVPVHDQHGDFYLLQLFSEICFRESLDAIVRSLDAALHTLVPEVLTNTLGGLCPGPVVTEEWQCEVLVELGTVIYDAGTDAIQRLDRCPAWVARRLDHHRGHGAHQNRSRYAARTMTAEVPHDFAASCRV